MTNMIQTSKDILFIVLGISVLAVSFFLCLFLYYLISFIRRFYKAARLIEKIGQRLDEITKSVRDKVREFTLVPLLSEAIRAVIEFLKEKRGEKEEKE